MNRKKLLPLAVLAGVVVLLAAALLAVTLLNRRQDGEESGIALFSVSAGEVTALSYQDGSTDVALTQNEDGGWTLESDPLLPIDSDTVTDLLDSLTGLTALRDLSGETLESAQLGFDSPAMTFAFTAGGTDYTLTVGAENSIAGAYYVRLGDGGVYTVSTSSFSTLCKTPRQLYAAQDITDMESTDVAAMTLDTGSEVLSFTRDGDGSWTLDEDPACALDQDAVALMANTICSLTSSWSITTPAADVQYGLDTPAAVVTLTDGDGRTVQCTFGGTDPDDDSVAYLRASTDESVVYEIAANHLSVFAQTKVSLQADTDTAETATAESAAG